MTKRVIDQIIDVVNSDYSLVQAEIYALDEVSQIIDSIKNLGKNDPFDTYHRFVLEVNVPELIRRIELLIKAREFRDNNKGRAAEYRRMIEKIAT